MSLLRMSLSGAVIVLAVTVIRAITLHKLPKKLFLAFWEIALVRLLLPVSFPSLINRFMLTKRRVPAADPVEKCISGLEKEAAQALHVDTPVISAAHLLWIVGATLCFAYLVLRYLRCRQEFKTSLPVQNDFVQKWLFEHPLRRAIDVRSLTGLSTPLTYGLFRPVILVPKNTDWGKECQLRYVLFHEYVHICRFDAIRKWIVAVAVCVHWFNPMAWVLYILYNRDIELACDERVLHRFGSDDRASYARALICMEETRRHFTPLYNCFAKNAIEERIEAIMKFRKISVSTLVLVLIFVTAVTGTAFAASQAQEADVPDKTSDSAPLTEPSDQEKPDEESPEKVETGFVKVRAEGKDGQTIILIDSGDPSCRVTETDAEILYEMGSGTLTVHKDAPSELLA